MKYLKGFIIAFAMYSKVPMPRVEWEQENMKYVVRMRAAAPGNFPGLLPVGPGFSLFLQIPNFFPSAVFPLTTCLHMIKKQKKGLCYVLLFWNLSDSLHLLFLSVLLEVKLHHRKNPLYGFLSEGMYAQ